jgi:mRNA-degrading endonuclease toxin of MazEF toxin-antitoxin module
VKRNEIVVVELPPPLGGSGREQTGRRPAVLVQDEMPSLPTLLVAPLTSKLGALRFPYTFRVEPPSENGLGVPSVALPFQLQVVDRRRVLQVVGTLGPRCVRQLDARGTFRKNLSMENCLPLRQVSSASCLRRQNHRSGGTGTSNLPPPAKNERGLPGSRVPQGPSFGRRLARAHRPDPTATWTCW